MISYSSSLNLKLFAVLKKKVLFKKSTPNLSEYVVNRTDMYAKKTYDVGAALAVYGTYMGLT